MTRDLSCLQTGGNSHTKEAARLVGKVELNAPGGFPFCGHLGRPKSTHPRHFYAGVPPGLDF